ncbi:MAG: hypothetical protein ACOC8N_01485 [Spirochaetota bacterium]
MDPVIRVVNRSNQRGGRMLSVIDLVEAGTLSPSLCAWLLGRVRQGGSWLVGARPGGAGKTTVMSALLAMLPAGVTVRLTNPGTGWERSRPGDCVVCYEISPGAYDAYLWGEGVRLLTELGRTGCRIVSNLHADILQEAREQVVGRCGASEEGFGAFGLFIPLSLRGSRVPVVRRVHLFERGSWRAVDDPESAPDSGIERFLEDCLRGGIRTVEQVRAAWLARG